MLVISSEAIKTGSPPHIVYKDMFYGYYCSCVFLEMYTILKHGKMFCHLKFQIGSHLQDVPIDGHQFVVILFHMGRAQNPHSLRKCSTKVVNISGYATFFFWQLILICDY